MSFGTTNDRAGKGSAVSNKKPKPKKGQEAATLAECNAGDLVTIQVRVYRWVKQSGSVWCRPLGAERRELEPLSLHGSVEVKR